MARVARHAVDAGKVLRFVCRQKLHTVELVAGTVGLREVAEDDVARGFAAEEQAAPLVAEGIALVEGDAGGRAVAVDIAGGDDAGVVLAPLRDLRGLARALVSLPATFAVAGVEAEVAVFLEVGRAGGGRIVVVVLKNVAEGSHGLLVAVAEIKTDGLDLRAVGIHAEGGAADVDVAVVAFFAGVVGGRRSLAGMPPPLLAGS